MSQDATRVERKQAQQAVEQLDRLVDQLKQAKHDQIYCHDVIQELGEHQDRDARSNSEKRFECQGNRHFSLHNESIIGVDVT